MTDKKAAATSIAASNASPFSLRRHSELPELKQKLWYAVPDNDPYRRTSVKESANVPHNDLSAGAFFEE